MQYTAENYGQTDLAKKYKASKSNAQASLDKDTLANYVQQLNQQGFVIIKNVLSRTQLASIKQDVMPRLDQAGRNNFEGENTQRLYSVVNKTMSCNGMIEHPWVLAIIDQILMQNYLLSQAQVINILPGEAQQPIHHDDAFYRVARPRAPLGVATVWALDDFSEKNGATVVIPKSHLWADKTPCPADLQAQQSVIMPAGSVVIFLGTLWHGGGANVSDASRLAFTAQYCEPWLRQQENFSLSVAAKTVAQCSEDMKRMLGYSIYGPFMGFVDGKHPKRLLEPYLTE